MKQPIKVTIDDMEETAQNEADGSCNKKINGKWLEVTFDEEQDGFWYLYNNKKINRFKAIDLLDKA